MSSEDKFLLIADKFLESDASVVQLSTSFNEFLDEAKERSNIKKNRDKAVETENLLTCILKYLHCIIEYAESGTAQARSATVRQLCNKICPAVEELKVKHEFIKNLSIPTFETLFGQPSWIAKEVLRMYSDTIQDSDRAVRLEAVGEKGPYYLGRLMDAIAFGDYEFQVMIVETLYRICTKEILNDMPKVYFLSQEQTEAFHKIDTDEFDLTVRNFLNLLNETEKHVVSLLCNKVTFDDILLQEPPELTPFKGMWVDFNVTSGTVTIFLDNERFNKDIKWEMITIFPENISRTETSFAFNEEKRKKEGIAKFILKGPCQLCYAPVQHKLLNCRSLTLHSLDTERFREVFNQVLPKINKKWKTKQASTLPYKKGYKPLDIISLKSSATNPSTSFNVTIDSIMAGRKHKSKSVGRKSVTFADSTMHTDSSKSRSLTSRKSMNISLDRSIQAVLEDISLVDYKIKSSKKSGDKSKGSEVMDEISSNSNLSVLNLVETRRNDGRVVASKKIRLSGLEELDKHEHGTSKNVPYSKYNEKFLSSLMEMEDNIDVFPSYNKNTYKNLDRKGKKELMRKEADSTTPVSVLYNSKLSVKDESISSDAFYSIEDIDYDNMEKSFEAKYGKKKSKSDLIMETQDRKQDNKISQIIASTFERSLSVVSADDYLNPKRNESKKKEVRKKKLDSKILKVKQQNKIIKDNTGIRENTEKGSCLGMKLSPDLFTCESQEIVNDQDIQPNKTNEILKNTSENGNFVPLRSCKLLEIQDSLCIDPVRDCQLDELEEFDKLKLERPKEVDVESFKDKISPEPDLIQISQPKFQSPRFTETEIFETAKMDFNDDVVEEIQSSGRNLDLFQDISQVNHNFATSSQEDSPEAEIVLSEENKSRIKVLSNIQIQSPILKSYLSQDTSQSKNSFSQQKENIRPAQEMKKSVRLSPSSCQNTDSQLVKKSPKIKPPKKSYNSDEKILETVKTKSLNTSQDITETNTNIAKFDILFTNQKHEVKTAEMAHSETQITISSEEKVLVEETIHCTATSQEQQYSETQEIYAQATPPKYGVKTSQKSHEEEPLNYEGTFPNAQLLHIQKDESKSTAFPQKNEVIISSQIDDHAEDKMNCEVQSPKSQKIDSQYVPSSKNSEREESHQERKEQEWGTKQESKKKVQFKEKKIEEDEVNQSNRLISHDVVEELGYTKEVSKTENKRKRRKILNPKKRDISKVRKKEIQKKSIIPSVGLSTMPLIIEKYSSITQKVDEDDIPLSELKQLCTNEIVVQNPKIQLGADLTTSELKLHLGSEVRHSPNEGSHKKLKMKIQTDKESRNAGIDNRNIQNKDSTQEYVHNENIIIHNIAKIGEKKFSDENFTDIREWNETDDIPLSKLKQLLKSKIVDTNTKSKVDGETLPINLKENHTEFSKVAENIMSQNEDDLDRRNMQIPTDEGNYSKYQTQKHIDREKEENVHSGLSINEKESGVKYDVNVDIAYSDSKVVSKTTLALKEKEDICENPTSQKTFFEENVPCEYQTQLQSQKHIDREKAENVHSGLSINERESGVKYDVEVDIAYLDSKVVSKTPVALKEKEDIREYPTSKKTFFEDNVPFVVEKSSSGNNIGIQEAENQKPPNEISQHSTKKNPSSVEAVVYDQYLQSKENELHKDSESLPHKKANLTKKMSEADNFKMKKPEVDELEQSLHLLFGAEVNEPLREYVNSVSSEIPAKNITVDTTSSLIAGNVGMLKRGRKLFDPENKEENFLNYTIIEQETANNNDNEEEPNDLQSRPKYYEKKQRKKNNTSSIYDEEAHRESKKINRSDAGRQKKKEEKNKSKRKSELHTKQHRPSKLDFIKYSRKKRLDAFYDKVIEKLKSQNFSSKTSFPVTPKVKRSGHDSVGKYDLDFSTMNDTVSKKRRKYESKLNHSLNKGIIDIEEGDGDGSKKRNVVVESQEDDTDEIIRVILRGLGTLCQKIAQGTLKKPSPSIQKNLFAAADLLLEL